MNDTPDIETKKQRMQDFCHNLQERICHTLETLEARAADLSLPAFSVTSGLSEKEGPFHFKRTPWKRPVREGGGGGGQMSLLSARLFEKAGVHTSTVWGVFSEEFRDKIPGTRENPQFWASGLSVIVHPSHPHVPAIHLNIRMIVTEKLWFGGGVDLTPMLPTRRSQEDSDSLFFHDALASVFQNRTNLSYAQCREACDAYFYLPHRDELRGVGGIFYDDLNSGEWEADFALTQAVGETFLSIYPELVQRNKTRPWSMQERMAQLVQRGRYVEFNLLYDRGTLFGLKTGGNIEAILSSLPPVVMWP